MERNDCCSISYPLRILYRLFLHLPSYPFTFLPLHSSFSINLPTSVSTLFNNFFSTSFLVAPTSGPSSSALTPPFPILYREAQNAKEDEEEEGEEEEEAMLSLARAADGSLGLGGGWRPRIQDGGEMGERIHDCAGGQGEC